MKLLLNRSRPQPAWTIAQQSLLEVLRDRTVLLLAVLFVLLVLVSAYLGWSATDTVNRIYHDAIGYLSAQGQPLPPNPVQEQSALGLMRNLAIYVSLIGALASIVIGHQLVAMDRKSSVLPLIGSRPLAPREYTLGKVVALVGAEGMLMGVASVIAAGTFLLLPQVRLSPADWGHLALFLGLAYGYQLLFGLLALGVAARGRSESVGLLVPVTVWLTVTFIFPSLTANVHPTAAINPISALALPPDAPFFHWTGALVGSVSIAESFKYLSAKLLGYLPSGVPVQAWIPPLPSLLLALTLVTLYAVRSVNMLDRTQGGYDA